MTAKTKAKQTRKKYPNARFWGYVLAAHVFHQQWLRFTAPTPGAEHIVYAWEPLTDELIDEIFPMTRLVAAELLMREFRLEREANHDDAA